MFRNKHSYFTIGLLSAIFFTILLTILAKEHPYFYLDLEVSRLLQSLESEVLTKVMVLISWAGYSPQSWLIVGAIATLIICISNIKNGGFFLMSVAGALGISLISKAWVGRVRPDPELVNQLGNFTNPDSFPSGHVLFYTSACGFLTYSIYTKKDYKYKALATACLSLLILLSGVSRIYLGAHWFSDVLGAYLLGLIWLVIIVNIYRRVTAK